MALDYDGREPQQFLIRRRRVAWRMAVYRRLYSNYHGVLPYAICRDDPNKKMAATLKVHK